MACIQDVVFLMQVYAYLKNFWLWILYVQQ